MSATFLVSREHLDFIALAVDALHIRSLIYARISCTLHKHMQSHICVDIVDISVYLEKNFMCKRYQSFFSNIEVTNSETNIKNSAFFSARKTFNIVFRADINFRKLVQADNLLFSIKVTIYYYPKVQNMYFYI